MAVHMTARYRVKKDSVAICRKATEDFIAYVKEHEPGTRLYTSLQQANDDTIFLHYMIFDDEAARDQHANSEAVTRFTDLLYLHTLGEVRFFEYEVVASTG